VSAVVAAVFLSGTLPVSTRTIAEGPFDLYQQPLIVTKGSIGGLNSLSLLIDVRTIPSVVDGRISPQAESVR
jgi:hypothetical protein